MKWFAVFALTFVLLQVEARNKKRYEPEESCTAELRLSRRKMKIAINDDNTPEDHRTYGKFLVCVFKKRSITYEDGSINEGGLRTFLQLVFYDRSGVTDAQRQTVQYVWERCKDIHSHTPERTAVKLKNCIAKYIHEFESDF